MQTKQVFLVFDFTHGKEKNESRIYGVFDNRDSAVAYIEKLKKEDEGNAVNPQVMPIHMQIGNKENECESFDFRKHIAFDITQMESPVRCDICMQNATHFCIHHRGVYCISHIVAHEDKPFGFYKKNRQSFAVKRVTDLDQYENDAIFFSEEDVDLVSQQAGVDREKARSALIEANGDLARAILLLTSR